MTYSQATTYNRDVNHALVNTMYKKDSRLNGLSEMEQMSFKLTNHESFVGMVNSEAGSTIQQIPMRIAYLYNHLKDFMHSHITDLNYMPDNQYRPRNMTSRSDNGGLSNVKHHNYSVNCETDEDYYNGDGEGDHQEEDVFYTGFKNFPKGYIEHDTEAAVKDNSDPQRKKHHESLPMRSVRPSFD